MDLQSKEQRNCFDVRNIDLRPSGERLPIPLRSLQEIDEDGLTTEEQRSKKKEMDEILAQTLSGLTFEERQHNHEILHGVDEGIAEEASFIDDKLVELNLHLLQTKEGSMYEVAERQDPEFVNDRAFRMMFLRGNEYDPRAASDQMIRFFESKYELFGQSKLTKHITMQDLDADDIAALESGWLQHIGMDQSGRQVWLHVAGVATYGCGSKALMSCLRAQYFFAMKKLQSEQTQLRGQITIWYIVGNFKNKSSAGYKEQYAAANCIPRKTAALHLCVDDLYQYALIHDLVVKLMKRNVRARFRVHFGSQLECQYQLATFGVSPSALPIDDRGRLDLTEHRKWIQACAEEGNIPCGPSSLSPGASLQTGTKPNQNDVLFHNGRSSGYHSGNKRFRAIIQDHSQAYADSATDGAKRQIVATVIGKVHASGGRFLKQSADSATACEEVPPTELRQKIMQSFRNRLRLNAGSNQAANESSGVLIAGNPLPNDVIFGRTPQRNAGSEFLNRLIKENSKEYDSLDRGKKMMVVESIVQQVKDRNCRFVQVDPKTGRWIEVTDDNARERISKSFRNLRRYESKKAK